MKLNKQFTIIITIIIIAGLLGGLGNYLINADSLKDINDISSISIFKSLVLGVIAAGIVPLVLGLISSNIIDFNSSETEIIYPKMIKFFSFCLLAAVFSNFFIKDAYTLVNGKITELEKRVTINDKKTEEAIQKSDVAKVKSLEANEKSDAALKSEKLSTTVIEKTQPKAKKIKENLIEDVVEKEDLNSSEKKIFSEIQNSIFIKKSDMFKNKNSSDSLNIQKIIDKLKEKELIIEATVSHDNVYLSKAL